MLLTNWMTFTGTISCDTSIACDSYTTGRTNLLYPVVRWSIRGPVSAVISGRKQMHTLW